MKKLLLAFIFISFLLTPCRAYASQSFDDVPPERWSYEYVNTLRELNITQGIGENKFGPALNITKAEFTAFLCNLLKYPMENPAAPSFADVPASKWYFNYIETAVKNGIVTVTASEFKPESHITRQEMAIMIVRALGYDELAKSLGTDKPFTDVEENRGYIAIAKDLGVISGVSLTNFEPYATATREQAAAMMVRMYNTNNNIITETNGFYAIKSASQQDMIDILEYVSFGWSRLEAGDSDLFLNVTAQNNNEYRIPDGYETPYNKAAIKMLMVAVKDADSSAIINDKTLRDKAVTLIGDAVNYGVARDSALIKFDGVVVDFETLRGAESRGNFNTFLSDLRRSLGNKLIFTAVHPKREGNLSYFDGYDYKTIGDLSDKVILMAHDYNAKSLSPLEMELNLYTTPLAPINEVYYALKAATDLETGIADKSKIMLQLNFATCQWKMKEGAIVNDTPYSPDYETLYNRIKTGNVEINYSKTYESPYITFYNEPDGTDNIIWYEDSRSVSAKIQLARHFGLTGLSLWRLGNIPDFSSIYYLNVKNNL